MKVALVVACVGLVVAVLPATAADRATDRSVRITRAQYGKRWPFTVKAGLLACSGNAVTFRAGGVTYAINGTAIMLKRGAEIRRSRIWRKDPAYHGLGLKVNIGPIIERGLRLC